MSTNCAATGAAHTELMGRTGAGDIDLSNASFKATRYFPSSSTVKAVRRLHQREAMRGLVGTHADDVTPDIIDVGGRVVGEFGRGELVDWLIWALGDQTGSPTDEYLLKNDLVPFTLAQRIGNTYRKFRDCYVNNATFTVEERGALMGGFDIIGKTYTEPNSTLFGQFRTNALTKSTLQSRSILASEMALTIASNPIKVERVQFQIQNSLRAQFLGGPTASCIARDGRRVVTATCRFPLGTDVEGLIEAGGTGMELALGFIAADTSEFSILAPMIKYEDPDPEFDGPGVVPHELTFVCYESGTGGGAKREIEITSSVAA